MPRSQKKMTKLATKIFICQILNRQITDHIQGTGIYSNLGN